AFSNSNEEVWQVIQKGLAAAGFQTRSVHLLDKGQPSIKGVKGVAGKEHVTTIDLVLTLEHCKGAIQMAAPFPPPPSRIDQIIRETLSDPASGNGHRTDEVYSSVVRAVVEANYSVSGISMPGIAARCEALGAVDRRGRWTLPRDDSPAGSSDFV